MLPLKSILDIWITLGYTLPLINSNPDCESHFMYVHQDPVAIPQPMDLFWNISLRVLAYAILLATWLAQVQASCTLFDKCPESPLVSRFQLLDCLLYFPTFHLRYVIRTSSSSGLSCIEKQVTLFRVSATLSETGTWASSIHGLSIRRAYASS